MVLPVLVARLLESLLRWPRFFHGSRKVLPGGSLSVGGRSAGVLAKVAKDLPRFSLSSSKWFSLLSWWHVFLLLLVARMPDSWLRLPRFSQGSPKVFPSASPSLGGTSAGFLAKVANVH